MLPAQGTVRCRMGLDITRLIGGAWGGAGLSWRFWAWCLARLNSQGSAREGVRYQGVLGLTYAPRGLDITGAYRGARVSLRSVEISP
jgi:hypothetical protein